MQKTLLFACLSLFASAGAGSIPGTKVSYKIAQDAMTGGSASMVFVDAAEDTSGKTYMALVCDLGNATFRFYSKTSQTACNYTKFSNPEFDKLYEAAQAERDETRRNDLLRQADGIVREEAPYWFFNYNKAVMAYQPWVHGLRGNPQELAIQDYDKIWIDDTAPANRKAK